VHSGGFGPTFRWYIGQHYQTYPTCTYQLQISIYCNYEHCRTQHKSVAGKELFVRGFAQDIPDEKIKKFFSKNGVTVAQVQRVKGKQ